MKMNTLKVAAIIVVLTAVTVLMQGCGVAESLGRGCSGDTKDMCQTLFGGKNNEDQQINNTQQQKEIDDTTARINVIQSQMQTEIATMNSQQVQISALSVNQSANAAAITSLQSAQAASQQQINLLATNVVNLQSQNSVTEIIDPCGTQPGYNEVLLRTKNGDLLAFFQTNGTGNLFLVNLPIGSYATGDQTGCTFTVNAAKQVCDNTGCH